MTPRFTVVVAAYNVEDTVADTLKSLLACLTDEFELICVNDGSTDGTSARIDEALSLAKCPARRVDIAHAGVSCARNEGQRLARGEYVAFVDGDDRVTPDYAEMLLEYTRERKPDIVFFGVQSASERYSAAKSAIYGLTGESAIERCYVRHDYHLKHTAAAYRRDFLTRNSLLSAHGCRRCQDVEFMLRALLCARCVDIHPQRLYMYIRRDTSVTNVYAPYWFDGVDAMLRTVDFALDRGACKRTLETLAELSVYAFIMLSARALRVGDISLKALQREARLEYPGQEQRVLARARAHLPLFNKSRLALCAYRACPSAFIGLLRLVRREVAA